MKATLTVRPTVQPIGRVITRLALVGGVAFGCIFLFLQLCSTLIKVLQ
jgi:hypothetical protein